MATKSPIPATPDVIVRDLSKHLDQRITTMLHDYMERCGEAGIDYADASTLALSILSHYAACAAHELQLVERDFINVCKHQFGNTVDCVQDR